MFFASSKSRQKTKIGIMWLSKTSDHIQIKIKMPNPCQEPPASSKIPNQDLKDMDALCTFKIEVESQHQSMGVSKTSENIQIKIKIPNPSHEPPASFKAPKEDLKNMDVLSIFKIKVESPNLEHLCIKASDLIKIKNSMPNPVDMNLKQACSLHLKINQTAIDSEQWFIKDPSL